MTGSIDRPQPSRHMRTYSWRLAPEGTAVQVRDRIRHLDGGAASTTEDHDNWPRTLATRTDAETAPTIDMRNAIALKLSRRASRCGARLQVHRSRRLDPPPSGQRPALRRVVYARNREPRNGERGTEFAWNCAASARLQPREPESLDTSSC